MFPADHGDVRGRLFAFDAVSGDANWVINDMFQDYSGRRPPIAGALEGWFRAVDESSGNVL
jgi:hypothetical protein